ncbi:MAG TPA: hypothetical protein P5249_04165 [Smithellaceae bacterium]|nr:hypothetical protein [Smithellaceae bacterium]
MKQTKVHKFGSNNSGFTLVVVLLLSLAIMLLGGTAMYLAAINFKTTAADIKYNHAEKAANTGLLNAFDEINRQGTGGANRSISGTMRNTAYATDILYAGRNLWFLSSEGSLHNSRVIKTALFQSYSGVGLYTVRGNVNALLNHGARLSGCDSSDDPDCFVPAFIASGTIRTGSNERKSCTAAGAADGTTAGLFGAPAILNMRQGDLSVIFFKVDCFNKYNQAGCATSLLDYLEYDYGRNPADHRQDFSFGQNDNALGIPIVSIPALPPVPAVTSGCIFPVSGNMHGRILNLSSDLITCKQIILNSAATTVIIRGDGTRNRAPVEIFTEGNLNQTKFEGASNFAFYTTNNDKALDVSNSSNFIVHSSNEVTMNNTNTSFTLYTTGITNLNGTVSGTADRPFRIVSANRINTGSAGISLTNGSIMTGPIAYADTNQVNAPQNLEVAGNLTIENAGIFTRSLRFSKNSTVRILDSLVYVYAHACPNCSRQQSDSSLIACGTTDNRWCGWYGEDLNLNIGRAADGTAKPVLFISNNTTVQTIHPVGTVYIWGVWYGEGVTHLSWKESATQNLNGFLARNFPSGMTLGVTLPGSGFTMNFSKQMMDAVAKKYRFFRKVECVRDPLTPKAQLLQTGMTSY